MRFYIALFIIFFYFGINSAIAQIEKAIPTLRIEAEKQEENFKTPDGLKLPPRKIPGLTIEKEPEIPNNSNFGNPEEKKIEFSKGDGLMDYTTKVIPKGFSDDEGLENALKRNQDLGRVTTSGKEVTIMFRDFGAVDGDQIRILFNLDILRPNETLDEFFKSMTIPLTKGENVIDFLALNQGQSGPNTAELHVYNDKGMLISAEQWNLLTGYKATIIVVKE